MSDSDCSNCNKENCPWVDYSYDCYALKVSEVKELVTYETVEKIKYMVKFLSSIKDSRLEDESMAALNGLNNILELYNESHLR